MNWRPSSERNPIDRFETKLLQAEALAHVTVCEDFAEFNDALQNNVRWLLADLLTEAREAHDEVVQQRAKAGV